jgi:hypothetical protein
MMKKNVFLAVAIALVTVGSSTWAATTWDLTNNGNCNSSSNGSTCTGSAAIGVSGWSTGTGAIGSTTSGNAFAAAKVYNWGSNGLGVVGVNENSSTTGPHAADNVYGTDAFLIKFSSGPVNLSTVNIGWNGTDNTTGSYKDSDLSVLAWTGSSSGPSMTGALLAGASGLVNSGWTLIGNYADVGASNGTSSGGAATVTNSVFSSYWLISAYNSAAFGSSSKNGGTLTDTNDAFKLLSVAGNTCKGTQCTPGQTPEPGSIALLGAGMLGLLATRRKFAKK